MHHYIDIHLRPDSEIAPHQLMSGLYGRLHRGLVQAGRQDIGISFPQHDERLPTLGEVLRLHGSGEALDALQATSWLTGLQDQVRVQPQRAVPPGAAHRVVGRVQAKSNVDRLRRRAMKRHGIDGGEAARRIPETAQERIWLPFVTIGSRSTGQASFRLFIRHGGLVAQAKEGVFNSYGLSQEATVPWF